MVTGSRWDEVDEIFSAALDLPAKERARWLDGVCAGRPELQAEVERLIGFAEEEDERIPSGRKGRILEVVHEYMGEAARHRLMQLVAPER